MKEVLKSKLQYEWKKIYRILNINDSHACGMVTVNKFEQAVLSAGVYFSKEDMQKVNKLYGYTPAEGEAMINYQRLSVDLGMHLHSFEYLHSHHSRQ